MIQTAKNLLSFITPVRIIERPDRLIIEDFRPTWPMFLAMVGVLVFSVAFVSFLLNAEIGIDSFGMWSTGLATLGCLAFGFRGTLREVYYFDKTNDSYAFVRRFIHKKEVIEGSLSQFRGVRVHTEIRSNAEGHRSERHVISLLQDGMLLGGAHEQRIREGTPILNFHKTESRIAAAIASFLNIDLIDTGD